MRYGSWTPRSNAQGARSARSSSVLLLRLKARLGRRGPGLATACSAHGLGRRRRRSQMSAQAPQEARLNLLELGVGRSRAGDHVHDLRERQRKDRQRHERQDQVLGLEILVQAAGALRVAEARGAFDARRAALLFDDGLAL